MKRYPISYDILLSRSLIKWPKNHWYELLFLSYIIKTNIKLMLVWILLKDSQYMMMIYNNCYIYIYIFDHDCIVIKNYGLYLLQVLFFTIGCCSDGFLALFYWHYMMLNIHFNHLNMNRNGKWIGTWKIIIIDYFDRIVRYIYAVQRRTY